MNKKGFEMGMLVKIILWMAIALLIFIIIKRYVVDAGFWVFGPADALIG